MSRNSRAEFLVDANHLIAAYTANSSDLPGLEPLYSELSTLVTDLNNLSIIQDAQTAAVQQTTQEINERLTRGRLLVTRMRNGVKSRYGTRTEKVIEFGIRPYRKPIRTPKPAEEVPTKPLADVSTPTP